MVTQELFRKTYFIHGVNLSFTSNNSYIFFAVNDLLQYFQTSISEELLFPADLAISLFDHPVNNFSIEEKDTLSLKLLYASSENDRFSLNDFGLDRMYLYESEDGFTHYINLGDTGFISYSAKEGIANGYLRHPEFLNPNIISSFIFIFVLSQLLKSKGYFFVHCSAVEKDGAGIIFPGFSGAGKTTSCIALIRAGYGFLGDDRPILHYSSVGNLEFLCFPEPIDVTDYTISLFPELKNYHRFLNNRNLRKRSFVVQELYPSIIKDFCIPRIILFPEISSTAESYLEPFSKFEAFKTFLPHSLLAFDKEITQKHFDIIFDLIQTTDCYKLKLGKDIENLPQLVSSIL